MLSALTRSRSASYHRRTMLKVALIALVLYVAWEPIRPVRHVTADVLDTIAAQVRR